jgi:hypothetical protein
MGIEVATFLSQLVPANPPPGDSKTEGDDHLRLIKQSLQNTFPNGSKAFYFPDSSAAVAGTVNVVAADENTTIPVDATGGVRTVNLPGGVNDGFQVTLFKSDSSVNAVTIDPAGATLINGQGTLTLDSPFESITCRWLNTFGAWLGLRGIAGNPFDLDSAATTYAGILTLSATEKVKLPVGTTAQRPVAPVAGDTRINSSDVLLEYFDGSRWQQVRELAPPPGWYLSASATDPVIAADALASGTVSLHPFMSGVGIYSDGVSIKPFPYVAVQTLTLNNPGHAPNVLYDVFVWLDTGTLRVVTGPAWANSGAGTGARSTALVRLNGVWVNSGAMGTRNGGSTFTTPDKQGVYVGTIFLDAVSGQLTCHRSFGQSRKWGIWNAYNRQTIALKAGDGTASWSNPGASYRASNAAAANSLTTFCGLPEESALAAFNQYVTHGGGAVYNEDSNIAIGLNSTTVKSGMVGRSDLQGTGSGTSTSLGAQMTARFTLVPSLGINTINALERATAGTASTFFGTEDHMGLFAEWRG